LALANSLRRDLPQKVLQVAISLDYRPEHEARISPPPDFAPVTLLSGESGQGKTWVLCRAAIAEAASGRLALLTRAPQSCRDLVEFISRSIWEDAYGDPGTIAQMKQRVGPHFADDADFWLTLYVDDIQDPSFARELKQRDLASDGIRLVISCQPRIADILAGGPNARDIPVGDFTSADLRRFLASHQRDQALETMPDDVFELLLKPIHAAIFARLPPRQSWVGHTEYELFGSYWTHAVKVARDQRDHRSDAVKLLSLARLVTSDPPAYPIDNRRRLAAGVDDDVLLRLEQVGFVQWRTTDSVAFTSDRMLNWAVAEATVACIVDERLPPEVADLTLASLEELNSPSAPDLGRRLGYVFLDALWLLCARCEPAFVAGLLQARIARKPSEWQSSDMWTDHLGTIGKSLLPVLEHLARVLDVEDPLNIRPNVAATMTAVGTVDASQVHKSVERLLATGNSAAVAIAIAVAGRIPCGGAIDAIWQVHLERSSTYRDHEPEEGSFGHRRERLYDLQRRSARALRLAISQKPAWLVRQLNTNEDPRALEELVSALARAGTMGFERASALWAETRERLVQLLPSDSFALVVAIEYFRDRSLSDWLDQVPQDPSKFTSARVRRARALIDPTRALDDLACSRDAADWPLSNWWVRDLAERDPDGLAEAVQRRFAQSEDRMIEMVRLYQSKPGSITSEILERLLDEFAAALERFNRDPSTDAQASSPFWHVLDFLAHLSEPWQLAALARRADTLLDDALSNFAASRPGRSSRNFDHEGSNAERILAAIGGKGFDRLVAAELRRSNLFGREDGYKLALWSEDAGVRTALLEALGDPASDTYREVIRMEAAAVHGLDDALEAMVRAGSPVYVNAAYSRVERPTEELCARVAELARSRNPEEQRIAASLAGFLPDEVVGPILLPLFVADATSAETRVAIIATFNAAGVYDPSMLTSAAALLTSEPDQAAHLVAFYLARHGGREGRSAVAEWMGGRDLGHGSASDRSCLEEMARHDDGREAIVAMLRRSIDNGHLLHDSWQLRLMAEAGDSTAQQQLKKDAYRKSPFGPGRRLTAIRFIAREDIEEACFYARRMWEMERHPAALEMIFDLDEGDGLRAAFDAYRRAGYGLRLEIARVLRSMAPREELAARLEVWAHSENPTDRHIAAEIGGWLPPDTATPWLDALRSDIEEEVADGAGKASERRHRQTAVLEHLKQMEGASKCRRWARLHAIFELADPNLLWRRDDPLSLGPFLEASPHEFFVEAERLKRKGESDRQSDIRREEQWERDGRA
jgi:hypothetical protein